MFCVRRKILLQVELLRLFTGRFKPILFNCVFSSQRVEFPGDWRERSMAFLHSASYSCSKGHLHPPPKSRTWVEVPPAYSRDKMLTGGYLNKSSLILFFLVQAPYLPSLNTCYGKFISLQVTLEAIIQFFFSTLTQLFKYLRSIPSMPLLQHLEHAVFCFQNAHSLLANSINPLPYLAQVSRNLQKGGMIP